MPAHSHEPHFCILREAGTLEAMLQGVRDAAAADDGEGGLGDLWSPVRGRWGSGAVDGGGASDGWMASERHSSHSLPCSALS